MLAGLKRAFERRLFASGEAFEGLVHAVEHRAGTKLVAHTLLGIDNLIVDACGQVDVREIVLSGRTVHAGKRGIGLAQALKALVHIVVGDFGGGNLNRQVGKLRKVELRAHLDFSGELQLRVGILGVRDVLDVELRLVHGAQILLLHSLVVELRNGILHGLAGDGAETKTLLDELAGHMTLAESGDVDLLGDVGASFVKIRLQLVVLHGDGEPDLGRLEVPHADFHSALQFDSDGLRP